MPFVPDKIEKRMTLHAPVSRVWRAISDAREFGEWFGVHLTGEFAPGRTLTGNFGSDLSEEAILQYQRKIGLSPSPVRLPDGDMQFCTVDRVQPPHYLSFRWTPYGIDADVQPRDEPTTLVEFRLEEIPEGTRLSIVESGFSRVPARRRDRAFRMDEAGWSAQQDNIRRYVEHP